MSAEVFEEHRSLLTGVAYRVLGTVSDAEDAVQEAWLRWSGTDTARVEDPRAYLVTVVSRLAIDRLRKAGSRRESYVGEWLPEPISSEPDAEQRAETADSVEFALLVVLETLSPLERAVFVLREAFQFPYADIAEIIGRGEAATRQLSRRAREHVRERRPRFEADRKARRRITERFLTASLEGDLTGLTTLLADDAALVADSGGKTRAPTRVVHGGNKVGRFIVGVSTNTHKFLESVGLPPDTEYRLSIEDVNGAPAALLLAGDRVLAMFLLEIVDGRVQYVFLVSNPDKLRRVRPSSW